MVTFDQILPEMTKVLLANQGLIDGLDWLLVNRDLNGRVRLIVPERNRNEIERIEAVYCDLANKIQPHAYPSKSGILFEFERDDAYQGASAFKLAELNNVWVIDRLATESRWETIKDVSNGAPRIVFFSIKGGVGRSTALTASAWWLAKQGKRVLVLDLDLESPGLSSALLPADRQPIFGITDWLVEDLVDNGDHILRDLYGTSDLRTNGSIYLVPAHGRDPGEYVSKLGRAWMPKLIAGNRPESWPQRLDRLVQALEQQHKPDVILIDSRAGIDEVAAACVTDLGANTVLMFAIQGQQTWTGYRSLFKHWQQCGVIAKIRGQLQLVAGLVPDDERTLEYLAALRADSYAVFQETYDEVEAGGVAEWNFEEDDDNAPHAPLRIRWNRGWYGLLSLSQRMEQVNETDVTAVYGEVLDFLDRAVGRGAAT
jgi:hypothetical protein